VRTSVWQNSLWLIGGNGLRLIFSGAYFLLLARLLEPAQFGLFSAILACSNLASPFAYWGQPELLVQLLSRHPQNLNWIWGNALLMGSCGGITLSVLLVIPLSLWLPTADAVTIFLLLLSELGLVGLQEVHKGVLVAQEQIATVALIDTGMALSRLLIVGLAWLIGYRSLQQWALLYVGMASAVGVITSCRLLRQWGQPRIQLEKLGGMGIAGWDFAVGLAATKTFTDLDKLLLPRLSTAAAAGYYSAAYRIINFAITPILAILTSSFPEICRQGQQGFRQGCRSATRLLPWILAYGCVATGGIALGSGWIPFILGEEYRETAIILRWLSAVVTLESVHALFSFLLAGVGLQQPRSWIQLAALALNGGLNLWWIPLAGWRGAAAATLLSETALVLAVLLFTLWRWYGSKADP
jgi:O-antigen/teichoic acid export membrane protein